MSFSVRGNFFYIYKTGDNIRYNLSCLEVLYRQLGVLEEEEKSLLLKPIIILEVSIIEAVLHDFHSRIKSNMWSEALNLKEDILSYVRGKKIDEFEAYIASAKKHDFFSEPKSSFYQRLEELRKMRNRIHIQNTKGYTPADEIAVFTERTLLSSERCLEKVLKTMSKKYFREGAYGGYVGNLILPWDEHFPTRV